MTEAFKNKIRENEFSFILAGDDGMRFSGIGRGIVPLMKFCLEKESEIDTLTAGLCAYDKVVGEGAAAVFLKLKAKSVYGAVMSEGARRLLEGEGVFAEYDVLTGKISNRTGTDLCPLEKLTAAAHGADAKFAAAKAFYENILKNN